jgi:hypothetical protein
MIEFTGIWQQASGIGKRFFLFFAVACSPLPDP